MKYSFLIPYLNRYDQFKVALDSFRYHYAGRDDWEIIVIEDLKNKNDKQLHSGLLDIIKHFHNLKILRLDYSIDNCYNPAGMFNLGRRYAGGQYVVLTNPEIEHKTNILSGFDKHLSENPNQYIVCPCKSQDHRAPWYVHPQYQPTPLHFCSVLSTTLYDKIGGFDEDFLCGIACEDNDFVEKVQHAGIFINIAEELLVLHLNHDRYYYLSQDEWFRRRIINGGILAHKRAARRSNK